MGRSIFVILTLLFYSGCSEFIEYDISNSYVEIIAPINGVETNSGEVRFGWRQVKGATGYKVLIVAPSFTNAEKVIADTMVAGTSYIHSIDSDGRYEWEITPCNSAYNGITMTHYFTVNTVPQ